MMDGMLNICKEKGFTSHDVVAKLRGILRQKKIGHTGTLDPEATGVLPVCLGKGTKLCEMLTDGDKTYEAGLLLGVVTDTQDLTGRILARTPVTVTEEAVRLAVESFLGEGMQIPPMYSAVKQGGKKLYELARKGIEVERPPRPVTFYRLEIKEMRLPRLTLEVECSKGAYIRTLCHDIGQALGCGGAMESLVRTRAGRFLLEDALTLSQVKELAAAGKLEERVYSVESFFFHLPSRHSLPEGDRLLHNGNSLSWALTEEGKEKGWVRMYDSRGAFIGVFSEKEGKEGCFPVKMFL